MDTLFQTEQTINGNATFDILNNPPKQSGAIGNTFEVTVEATNITENIIVTADGKEITTISANGTETFTFKTDVPARQSAATIVLDGKADVTMSVKG